MRSKRRSLSIRVADLARSGRGRVLVPRAVVALCVLAGALGVFGSSSALAFCTNEALRTGPSANLPDCRAYEQVTPQNKSSAVQDMDPSAIEAVSATDGNRVALKSQVAFGPRPMANGSLSMFTRGPSGWQVESIPPAGAGSAFYQEPIFNPDMTMIGVNSYTTTPVSPNQLFQVGPPGGPYNTTIAETPTNYQRFAEETDFLAGGTADFSRLFFESTDHTLLSTTPTGTVAAAHDLYEWEGGALRRLVNVQSDGSLVGECGGLFEGASRDGSSVVFVSPDPKAAFLGDPSCHQPTQLYLRVGSSTVAVSKPNTGVEDPTGPHSVKFQGVSADGSKVFFTTEAVLTHDAEGTHTAPGPDEDLYEYDVNAKEGERLTRISRGTTGAAEGNVNIEYVIASEDGSAVYFHARSKLTPDAPGLSGADSNIDNVYRYDTTTGEIHYIATAQLSGYPNAATTPGSPRLDEPDNEQVTPDGRFFVFVSPHVLGSPVNNPEELDEIYRYDSETAGLTCVSCPGNSAPARGGAILTGVGRISPGWDGVPSEHTLSEDGSYVFFQSDDELVPQDVNGIGDFPGTTTKLDPWTDVYEWHDGVVSLISSGTDSQPAVLVGASASGSDVFFMTHSQLVAGDTDSSADIYDARIGGGFPEATESAACLGDTCQVVPPAVNDPTPAWSSFSGPGNLVASVSGPRVGPVVRPLTRAQLLARALRACRVKHNRGRRRSCEAVARKRYGVAHRARRSTRSVARRSVSGNRGGLR
jgi:hypothetical protein